MLLCALRVKSVRFRLFSLRQKHFHNAINHHAALHHIFSI